MYPCPNCGKPAISFWRKSNALDWAPYHCPKCGKSVGMKWWPLIAYLVACLLVLPAFFIVGVKIGRIGLITIASLIVILLGIVAAVHFGPLTTVTERRTRIAIYVRWAGLALCVGWLTWKIAGEMANHVSAP